MDYTIVNHQHIFDSAKFFPQCHASTIEVLPDNSVVVAWFGGTHEKADDVCNGYHVGLTLTGASQS